MRIKIKTPVLGNYKEVLAKFDRDLFDVLIPPGIPVEVVQFDGSHTGDIVHLRMKFLPGLVDDWKVKITEEGEDGSRAWFIDEGTNLPFFLSKWRHKHIVEDHQGESRIVDDIWFKGPFFLFDLFLYPVLYVQFWMRKPLYKKFFGKIS